MNRKGFLGTLLGLVCVPFIKSKASIVPSGPPVPGDMITNAEGMKFMNGKFEWVTKPEIFDGDVYYGRDNQTITRLPIGKQERN